jgi:quinolinate synthase
MGFEDDIAAILELKKKRNAVILAHNYQTPEIFHCVADIVGDSLALARRAVDVDADVILLAGVHFMAETAKLLNPGKTVLIPDMEAGCSLAESITPPTSPCCARRIPACPMITYVNTSAAVKAASDICCTSGNAKQIVEGLGVPQGADDPGRVSGPQYCPADRRRDHRLAWPLRGA